MIVRVELSKMSDCIMCRTHLVLVVLCGHKYRSARECGVRSHVQ